MTARKKPAEAAAEEVTEEAPTAEAPAEETERQKRARLKTAATNALVERHRDEFNGIAGELFKANGLEFKRKLTPEEKAEKELEALLEANPNLRDKLAHKLGEQHSGDLNLSVSAETLTDQPTA